jgi:hypothetical protein
MPGRGDLTGLSRPSLWAPTATPAFSQLLDNLQSQFWASFLSLAKLNQTAAVSPRCPRGPNPPVSLVVLLVRAPTRHRCYSYDESGHFG